ncbi:MAG: GNAT family N-acetyltransferase [Chloroflexota bacterium]|jgi:hypothetical protein|nr:GNAT family N-acetyltransferase [Chloroflexota bacterium]MDP6507658.1 GNAT family N-acetyltransferase [Chloroflexota bacterium]MDP6757339.1 GNAT family N-acetyltransferase [Chloroflexota bacterium]
MQPAAVLELEYAALFEHDAEGRLAAVDRHGNPAPDLTIGRTDGVVVVRLRGDLSDDLAAKLTALADRETATASLEAPPAFDREYRRLLRMGDAAAEVYVAFVMEPSQRGGEPPDVVDIATLDRAALAEFSGLGTGLEGRLPGFAVVRDGSAVAVTCCACSGDGAAEAGVETLPRYRGRAYATAVTAAWVEAVRRSGRVAFYSAAAENAASLAVGRKLAGAPYAVMTHYRRPKRAGDRPAR